MFSVLDINLQCVGEGEGGMSVCIYMPLFTYQLFNDAGVLLILAPSHYMSASNNTLYVILCVCVCVCVCVCDMCTFSSS